MAIAVVETGYVGLSLMELLVQNREVIALNIVVPIKIVLLKQGISSIEDDEVKKHLADFKSTSKLITLNVTSKISLTATLDKHQAYQIADFVIITMPTNYDTVINIPKYKLKSIIKFKPLL